MYDFDIIETPENVNLQRRLAGIGSRFLAGLLDTLLIVLFYLILFFIFVFTGTSLSHIDPRRGDSAAMVLFAVVILIGSFTYLAYFIVFEMWRNGQTPGKRYMRIRVVQQEGAAVTLNAVIVRNLLRIVDFLGGYAVAGIAMFATKKVQRLGDLAAGTVVISEEIQDYASKADKKQRLLSQASPPAPNLATVGLKPEEYHLLHNYWLRRHELTTEARFRLLPGLIQPILDRMGDFIPEPSVAAMEAYVQDLLTRAQEAETQAPLPEPNPEEPL